MDDLQNTKIIVRSTSWGERTVHHEVQLFLKQQIPQDCALLRIEIADLEGLLKTLEEGRKYTIAVGYRSISYEVKQSFPPIV